jgi:hypothetical protein
MRRTWAGSPAEALYTIDECARLKYHETRLPTELCRRLLGSERPSAHEAEEVERNLGSEFGKFAIVESRPELTRQPLRTKVEKAIALGRKLEQAGEQVRVVFVHEGSLCTVKPESLPRGGQNWGEVVDKVLREVEQQVSEAERLRKIQQEREAEPFVERRGRMIGAHIDALPQDLRDPEKAMEWLAGLASLTISAPGSGGVIAQVTPVQRDRIEEAFREAGWTPLNEHKRGWQFWLSEPERTPENDFIRYKLVQLLDPERRCINWATPEAENFRG